MSGTRKRALCAASLATTVTLVIGTSAAAVPIDLYNDYADVCTDSTMWHSGSDGFAVEDAEVYAGPGCTPLGSYLNDDALDSYWLIWFRGGETTTYYGDTTGLESWFVEQTTDAGGDVILQGPVESHAGLDVTVQHRYYATGDLVRVLVSITNPGVAPITAITGTDNGAGSDDRFELLTTSNGDAALTVADDWMVTSDGYETDPVLSSAWQSAVGAVRAGTIEQYAEDGPVDNFRTGAQITVAPGATVYLAYFTKIYGYENPVPVGEDVGAATFVGADIAAAEAAALAGTTEWATLSGRMAVGIPAGANVLNWAPAAADPATPVVARPAFTG